MCELSDYRLITAVMNNSIYVWQKICIDDNEIYAEHFRFGAHTDNINCVIQIKNLDNNLIMIASALDDENICIWDLEK